MIRPGATIGILGGGQLGKMIALAAAYMGYKTHIFCPDPNSPAFEVTPHHTVAEYTDLEALQQFNDQTDVSTYEFENIPLDALQALKNVSPNPLFLLHSQNRLHEKKLFTDLNILTTEYIPIRNEADLPKVEAPSLLKTSTLGYDGKGQQRIDPSTDLSTISCGESILEKIVPFDEEVSIIVARNQRGEFSFFPLTQNHHEQGILRTSRAPAPNADQLKEQAEEVATKIANKLNLVGLLTIEFFVKDGQLIANEIAPRPHNSGHWTIEGCETSQYEQLIRAICDLPLGSTAVKKPTVMHNLIGDEANKWLSHYEDPHTKVHLYGKEVRPNRKMGHVTTTDLQPSEVV